ncbi:hypothetical protein DM02DRAFT_684776, partial [Periconia macrospinosa]
KYPWTKTHSFYAVMGGFVIDTAAIRNIALDYIEFLLENYPEVIPDIDEIDILDKSKGDWFTKAIVCTQGAWFCSQCISRLASDLTISLLELNTLGHCICMFFIYCMWWKKPKHEIQYPPSMALQDKNRNWPSSKGSVRATRTGWVLAGIWIAGIVYGGLHLLAWNAPFPTLAQQLLWRISTTTLTASGPIFTLGMGVSFIGEWLDERMNVDEWVLFIVVIPYVLFCLYVVFYIFCRVYLVVECFITLPYLPPSAFKVPLWSQYFIHFS